MKFKKLLSVLLAFVMLLSMLSVMAYADDPEPIEHSETLVDSGFKVNYKTTYKTNALPEVPAGSFLATAPIMDVEGAYVQLTLPGVDSLQEYFDPPVYSMVAGTTVEIQVDAYVPDMLGDGDDAEYYGYNACVDEYAAAQADDYSGPWDFWNLSWNVTADAYGTKDPVVLSEEYDNDTLKIKLTAQDAGYVIVNLRDGWYPCSNPLVIKIAVPEANVVELDAEGLATAMGVEQDVAESVLANLGAPIEGWLCSFCRAGEDNGLNLYSEPLTTAADSIFVFTPKDYLEEYANYECDFYVEFDEDVPADSVILVGSYGGMIIDILLGKDFVGNETKQFLISSVGDGSWSKTYREIYYDVETFLCTAVNIAPENIGKTAKVSLVIWPAGGNKETDAITICETDLTFTAENLSSIAYDGVNYQYVSNGYNANSYIVNENGWLAPQEAGTTGPHFAPVVAEIDGVGYPSLADAINAAVTASQTSGSQVTVTLLGNAQGVGLALYKNATTAGGISYPAATSANIVIDFGGYTYTVTDPVGSANTANQALHFEAGNTVKLYNGTINMTDDSSKLAAFNMVMQNYCSLTIENMTIDGTGIAVATYSSNYAAPWGGTTKPQFNYNTAGNSVIRNSTITVVGDMGIDDSANVTIGDDAVITANKIVTKGTDDRYTGATPTIVVETGAKFKLTQGVEEFTALLNADSQDLGTVDANGFHTVETLKVAQIGNTKYETLAAAIAAVPADGNETTITMLADEMIVGNAGVTIPTTKNIVLDLNGHTIKNAVNENKASQVINNKGTLTIKDSVGTGLITNAFQEGTDPGEWWSDPQRNYASNVIKNSGTLNMVSGTLLQTAANSICYAVDNNSTDNDAILNISGGSIKDACGTAVRMFCNSTTEENTINMTGGEISTTGYTAIWTQLPGSNTASMVKATINISGGTISGGTYAWYDYSYGNGWDNVEYSFTGGLFKGYISSNKTENNSSYTFVTGGKYSEDPSEYVAAGYEAVKLTDGEYANWYQVGKVAVTGELTPNANTTTGYDVTYTTDKTVVDESNNNAVLAETAAVTVNVVAQDTPTAAAELSQIEVANVVVDALAAVDVAENDTVNVTISVVSTEVNKTADKVTYEVHPEATVTVVGSAESVTVPISNNDLIDTFTVKLPVPNDLAAAAFSTNGNGYLKVTHKGATDEEVFSSLVLGEHDNYYVEFTVSHFSQFELEFVSMGATWADLRASLSLEDSIEINVYVDNLKDATGETEANPGRFSVRYTFHGVTKEVALTKATGNQIVVAKCAAKELADEVHIELLYDGLYVSDLYYSARDYCKYWIQYTGTPFEKKQELQKLCLDLLNYGAQAQLRFNYNTNDLANCLSGQSYGNNYSSVTASTVGSYGYEISEGRSSVCDQLGASLSLNDKTEINVYFKALGSLSNYSARVYASESAAENDVNDENGVALTITDSDVYGSNTGRITVPGIAAKDLDEYVYVKVSYGNASFILKYSPMTYVYRKLAQDDSTERDICKTLYLYNQAANEYFANN